MYTENSSSFLHRFAVRKIPGPVQRRVGGFSITEILVSLSLVSILASFVLPSYKDGTDKRQITHGAVLMGAFVGNIQSEALKRNLPVSVSYGAKDDGSWCIGAVVGVSPCDCMLVDSGESDYCALDSAAWVLRDTDVESKILVSSLAGDGSFTFDPVRGMLLDPKDTLILGLRSDDDQFQISLSVSNSGRVSMCLPSLSPIIPGFGSCLE